jgi:hypothetical protein
MITLATLLNIAALGFALLILWRVEPALSRMNGTTHWMIRYAMLLLAGGALGTIVTIYSGGSIDPITLFVLAGIALLLLCERRISYLIRIRKGGRHA